MPDEEVFTVEKPITPDTLQLLRSKTDELVGIQARLDKYRDVAKKLNEEADKLEATIIEILQQHNLSSQKWDDGLMVIRVTKKYPSVPGEFLEKFKHWLQRHGYWSAARVPTQTVNALLKERLENDQYIPPYIKVFPKDTLTIKGKSQAQQRAGQAGSPQEVPEE